MGVPTPPDGIDDDDDAMVEEEEDMTVMDATEEGPPSFFCMVVGITDKRWIGVCGPPTTINRTYQIWHLHKYNKGRRRFVSYKLSSTTSPNKDTGVN